TLVSRMQKGGYTFCVVAENLAKGQQDVDEALVGWTLSPGHRATMNLANVSEVGFGVAYAPSESENRSLSGLYSSLPGDHYAAESVPKTYQNYVWVQVFAHPC
ncbi:MAG TPA: CAP domain-containing protein, partial [Aliiroseovarius sp.]|nr:CAP domain-containing protein [Aliiroseovarius sp.]